MILSRSRHILLWCTFSLYCLLLLPRWRRAGMFLDGVTYASIARNMAEHYGSLWRPYYTHTLYSTFYEHPPLGFWLQAWAYRFYGDSVFIETLWGFCAGAFLFAGMSYLWSCHPGRNSRRAGSWLPIALCTILPMTSWILSNNLLENTMTVFILAAVSLCMLSLTCTSTAVSLLCGGLSGLAIVGAFLVKGPVALFPLVTPLFWFLYSQSRRRRGFTIFGVMLATLGVSALCLLYHAEARDFLQRYFAQQIYASIAGKRELSGSRFRVVYFVGQEILVPVLGGCFLTVVLSRSYKGAWSMLAYRTIEYRRLLYYLGLALAGSLPLLISPKQHRWYIFPALPFYVLATAELFNHVACCLEDLVKRQQRLRQSLVMATLALFSVACLMMWLVHDTPQRDKDFYHDFLAQPLHIDARETISVHPPALSTSWSLVANMQRHFHASLTTAVGYKYLLTTVEHVDSSNTYLSYWKIHPPFPAKYVFLRMDPQQNQEP